MKKIILSLLLVFTLSSVTNAQALLIILFGDKLSTETFQMGINASLYASNINGLIWRTKAISLKSSYLLLFSCYNGIKNHMNKYFP